ncbi:MAG TPA: hypothetical protein DCQ06_05645 [Myxococcales bacterium]|nr:hypothetical protein [Myxococcales bacterium]HAN31063.1 hypothetical protein [Myxococcales bacterium]|tara:strand:- start:599 stop:1030 length:432 start_codon:yes stop_codon:yes gene_type:complete
MVDFNRQADRHWTARVISWWQVCLAVCCGFAFLGHLETYRLMVALMSPIPVPSPFSNVYGCLLMSVLLVGVGAGLLGRLTALMPWGLFGSVLLLGDGIEQSLAGLQTHFGGWHPQVLLCTGLSELLASALLVFGFWAERRRPS